VVSQQYREGAKGVKVNERKRVPGGKAAREGGIIEHTILAPKPPPTPSGDLLPKKIREFHKEPKEEKSNVQRLRKKETWDINIKNEIMNYKGLIQASGETAKPPMPPSNAKGHGERRGAQRQKGKKDTGDMQGVLGGRGRLKLRKNYRDGEKDSKV